MTQEKLTCETGEFNGYPTIGFKDGDKYIFSIGLRKANIVVEHIDAIKAFVTEQAKVAKADTSSPSKKDLIAALAKLMKGK